GCRSVTRYVNFPRRREPPRTESRRAIAQRGGFKIKINFRYYDEHVVHLPDCYQPTDPQRVDAPKLLEQPNARTRKTLYFTCLLTSLVISNMLTWLRPPNIGFNRSSALIMRLFFWSCSPFFLM